MVPLRTHHIKYYSMKLLKFLYADTSKIVCKMWFLLAGEGGGRKRGRGGREGKEEKRRKKKRKV